MFRFMLTVILTPLLPKLVILSVLVMLGDHYHVMSLSSQIFH